MGKAGYVVAMVFAGIFLLIGLLFLAISLYKMNVLGESIFNAATAFEILFFAIYGILFYAARRAKPKKFGQQKY